MTPAAIRRGTIVPWCLMWLVFGHLRADGAIITKEQDLERRAANLFEKAQKDAVSGRPSEALDRYAALVKAYPRTGVAARAHWEVVRLNEAFGDYIAAFDALQILIDHFAGHFEKALRKQFEIALKMLTRYDALGRMPDGRAPKDMPKREQVSSMLRIVVENGPYVEFAAEANYYLAVALEKEGKAPQAAMQHEDFLDRFPKHALADDSAYQVAYILYKNWLKMKGGAPTHRERAAMAMQWFLARYPESDKAAQARRCLDEVRHGEKADLVQLAEYYQARGNERAAAVYYRELASRFPELATEGSGLRERVMALMEKYPELKDAPKQGDDLPGLGLPDGLMPPPEEMGLDVFDFEDWEEEEGALNVER